MGVGSAQAAETLWFEGRPRPRGLPAGRSRLQAVQFLLLSCEQCVDAAPGKPGSWGSGKSAGHPAAAPAAQGRWQHITSSLSFLDLIVYKLMVTRSKHVAELSS